MTPTMRRVLLLILTAALLAGVAILFTDAASLEYLQARRAGLVALHDAHPWTVRLVFFTLYAAAASLSLPGIALLTLAGGAVLGFWWGLLLVSFAASLGATVAFLSARYLLRQTVERRFGARLARINDGLQRDGALYLFSLRLIPVVPSFAINLGFGLTHLRVGTFYWVSQLGMLALHALYTQAGTRLANLQSLRSVLDPALLASLALLAVLPWLARITVARLRRTKAAHV